MKLNLKMALFFPTAQKNILITSQVKAQLGWINIFFFSPILVLPKFSSFSRFAFLTLDFSAPYSRLIKPFQMPLEPLCNQPLPSLPNILQQTFFCTSNHPTTWSCHVNGHQIWHSSWVQCIPVVLYSHICLREAFGHTNGQIRNLLRSHKNIFLSDLICSFISLTQSSMSG